MINIKSFIFNDFQENTFILSDETKECIIIDPGMSSSTEEEIIDNYIKENKLKPVAMINTHCHVDHILGCNIVKRKYSLPFYTHEEEIPLLEHAPEMGSIFGIEMESPPIPDKFLKNNDVFIFGNSEIIIYHVPGHSPGSLAFHNIPGEFVITGDVLFNGSIGRTDLPGGDYNTLLNSIRNKLMVLPRQTTAFPGHGDSTTIGKEYDTNPFLI
ncbi:MAG: MBL fold metallo-hydrolase [Bacteroidales bacterium]|nr:MBL fold metallo-hydrolase [Bacteroidales bacterium]